MSVAHGNLVHVQFAGEADITLVSAETLLPVELGYRVMERADLIRHLVALKFELPLADHIYARNASRARFEAHQFKPALKFFDSGRRRLLIADEVGLGKTIEAGIIMAEVNARNTSPMDRVMVICPSGLKEKWDDELYHRFGEQFTVADSHVLSDALDKFEQGRRRFKLIVPLEVIRARKFMDRIASLSATANFTIDMTIVDEAHHLRNPATLSHRVAETIGDISEALLFLTATPVQLGSVDLYHLLSILDEDLFPSEHIFDSLVRPNAIVNDLISGMTRGQLQRARAALDRLRAPRQDHAIASSPFFSRVAAVLDGHPTPDELARAVVDAKELHTLAGIFTRTRKREVQQAAHRRAQTVQIELTDEERMYYDAVGKYVRATAGATGASFAVVARERQAASCIPASVRYFKEAMAGRDEPAVEGWLTAYEANPRTADNPRTLRELIDLGKKCSKDSKLEAFLTVIRGLLAENASRKVIVFSFFKHTLRYLEEALRAEDVGYLLINGDVKPVERADRIRRFRTGTANVLLSSEVGAEGLDFQFCDALVNYDLPWNPMRVEQRIGRLDRYGQKSPSITIVSFVLGKTIEERILARLYERIGVFESSIGDLEPILGEIVGKLEREILSASLTPREEERIADELVRQIEIRKAQMEQLDGRMDEFIGNDDLIAQVSLRKEAGLTIEPTDLQEAVGWLAKSLRSNLRAVAGHEGIFSLSRSAYLASEIRRFLSQRRLQATDEQQDLIDGLDARDLWVVFDGDLATEHPGIKFIGISHPLARLAIERAQQERLSLLKRPVYRVTVPIAVEASPCGLFVFRLRYTGGNPGFRLFPVLVDGFGQRVEQSLAWSAFGALRLGGPSSAELASQDEFRSMEEAVLAHALEERNRLLAELRDRNDAVIAARANSIRQNFEARIRKRRQWAADADERIRRMRLAEARNLEDKLASHLAQLEEARDVDVDFQLVLRVLVETDMTSSGDKGAIVQVARQPASAARS